MANKMQIRRDTTANWNAVDPILSQGELGLDISLHQFKIGNGELTWSELGFFVGVQGPQGPAGLDGADGLQGPAGFTNEMINGDYTVTLNPNGVVSFPIKNNTQLLIDGSELIGVDSSPIALSSEESVVINTYNPSLHTWSFSNTGILTTPEIGRIDSLTSMLLQVGANTDIVALETAYTDAQIALADAFSLASIDSGFPWNITIPVSGETYDELIQLAPDTFPSQTAVTVSAHSAKTAYLVWQEALLLTKTGISVSDKVWTFNADGSVSMPTLSVDLHNGGIQSAQVLKFNDPTKQMIITGPTPAYNTNAERIIIQGPRGTGTGEGGDVYLWGGDSDANGGDIKIYAGDGQASPSNGGYVNIDGGSGYAYGGNVEITGGYASQFGGNVVLSAGNAGGQNGVSGQVNINSNGNQWVFGNDGRLTLPGPVYNNNYPNTISSNYGFVFTPTFNGSGLAPALYLSYNDGMLLQPITNDYRVNSNQASPFYIEGADVDGSVIPGDVFISGGRNYNTSVSGGIHIGTNKTSAVQIGASGVLTTITFADSSVQSTAYQKVAVPAHSYGVTGDKIGMVAFDADYMYYCTADYVDNTTNIWKRTSHGSGTW